MQHLVSIIMPLYNCEKYVLQAISSVVEQTYTHWELIIVDDCSTDNSYQLVQEAIKNNSQIHLYQLPSNRGVAEARNYAIKLSKGRFIALLDSDDRWLPEKLMKQVNHLIENNLVFTYSSYFIIDEENRRIGSVQAPLDITYHKELKGNRIGNLTAIFDSQKIGKKTFQSIGHEDYLFWLEILQKFHSTKGVKDCLAEYRLSQHTLSSDKLKAAKWTWNIYRDSLHLSLAKSVFYFSFYVANALLKYYLLILKK